MSKHSRTGEPGLIGRRNVLRMAGGAAATAMALGGAKAASAPRPGTPVPSDVLDVAIIGAGLSGLTAARDLRRAGCESFIILEARDRVGGRTLNFEIEGGYVSEVGGQWMGPGQTAVADLARELEVETFPTYYEGKTVALGGDGKVSLDLGGTFGTDPVLAAKLSQMSRDVPCAAPWTSAKRAELDQLSVGDWLKQQAVKPEDQNGWNSSIGLSGGVLPAKMGLLHYLSMINSANCDYEQLDAVKHSAQETRFVGGSQILSIKLAKQLEDKLRLSFPIRRISGWNEGVVTLHSDQGTVRARRVILALSPPLCNQIAFEPALPPQRAALHSAWPAHSPARKCAMVYSRPFWREKGLNGHIFQFGGPIIWAWDNSPPGGEIGIINAFVMNAMLPAELESAKSILSKLYAEALGPEALSPISYHDRDWGLADPWTITCVSAIPPGFWSTHGPALKPACGNLLWSGTETAEIWAGYMDGAVRAGRHSALQALNGLRKG